MALSNLEKLVAVIDKLPADIIDRFVVEINALRQNYGHKFFTLTELECVELTKDVLELVYQQREVALVKEGGANMEIGVERATKFDRHDLSNLVRYAPDAYLKEMRRGILTYHPDIRDKFQFFEADDIAKDWESGELN